MKISARLVPAAVIGLLGTIVPAYAQNNAQNNVQDNTTANYLEINPVVSIATYQDTPLSDVLLSTDVITQEEIAASTATSFGDLISQKTGIEVTRSGGPGGQMSVFLRGQASKNYVLMIDGIKVQTDLYGNIILPDMALNEIQSIEVLKGNASALYGEAAIGGVINVITKTSEMRDAGYASASYGSYGTEDFDAGLSKRLGGVDVTFNASSFETEGYNALNNPSGFGAPNPDKDGFSRVNYSLALAKRLSSKSKLSASFRQADSEGDYDNAYTPATNLHTFEQTNSDVSFAYEYADKGLLNTRLIYNKDNHQRDEFTNGVAGTKKKGDQSFYKLVNVSHFESGEARHAITQGVEVATADYKSNTTPSERDSQATFVGYTLASGRHDLQANLRSDEVAFSHSTGATKTVKHTSTLAGYGYQITKQVKAALARSTGFRAPDAYEHSVAPNLKAEEHTTNELSVTLTTQNTLLRSTLFSTSTKNAIEYSSPSYYNIGKSENKGVEINLDGTSDFADYQLSMTFQEPKLKDATTNPKLLQKRAKAYGSLYLSKQINDYRLGSKVTYSGRRLGVGGEMSSYVKVDANLLHNLTDTTTVLIKAENIFDAKYETTRGYNTAGRSVFLTLKYDFVPAY